MILPEDGAIIKIGALEYTIVYSKEVGAEGDCYGSIHYRTQKIYIDPQYPDDRKKMTLIHEIFHALIDNAGYGERFRQKTEVWPNEEEWCTTMGFSFYQVIKDNSHIFQEQV